MRHPANESIDRAATRSNCVRGRRPLRPDMIVTNELTLDTFLGDSFLKVSDEALPDRFWKPCGPKVSILRGRS
jgi:hypothetical protein